MIPHYSIRQKAIQDLQDIHEYSRNRWSQKQADTYLSLIIDKIESISISPEKGIRIEKIRHGYKVQKIMSHLIFYLDNPKTGGIEIVRILHEQMDIEGLLLP